MKNLFFFSIFFSCIINISLAQIWQIDWQQCFGGTENDFAKDLVEVVDGYLIIGNTNSDDGDVSFNHGFEDGWLLRVDSTGNLLWEISYGGTKGDGFNNIIDCMDGSYYLAGGANSSDGDISYDPYPNTTDYWIVKIDSTGAIIWDKILGGNGDDNFVGGIMTSDGGILSIGFANSQDGDMSVHYGQYDMWMIKLNNEGETEWDFTIGNSSLDFPGAIIQTTDGGYLVGGSSKIQGGGNLTCESHGNADAVIIKLDSLRNIEWQQCYGGSDYEGVYGLLELADGYIFTAYTNSNDGDVTGWHGEVDIWVVRLDYWGNIVWQKCLGGSNGEVSHHVLSSEDGGFVVIGQTRSNNGDVSGNHSISPFDHDIWMVKLDSDGEIEWQQCFGGEGNEATAGLKFGVLKKSESNYVIAAETDDQSGDVLCTPHSWQGDYWVFEITMPDTTTVTNVLNDRGFVVYPNPGRDYVIFEFLPPLVPPQGGKSPFIKLTTVFGQEVTSLLIKSEKTVWDTRRVNSGVYFYTFTVNGITESGKIVISK